LLTTPAQTPRSRLARYERPSVTTLRAPDTDKFLFRAVNDRNKYALALFAVKKAHIVTPHHLGGNTLCRIIVFIHVNLDNRFV
jgi:hypothetical protein